MSFVPTTFPSIDSPKIESNTSEIFLLTQRLKLLYTTKPWLEFFKLKHLSKPDGLLSIQNRIRVNLSYFYGNYTLILTIILIYCLYEKHYIFYCMVFIALWFGYLLPNIFPNGKEEFTIYGISVHRQQMFAIGIIISLPLLVIGSPIQFLINMVTLSCFVVLPHAIMYNPTYHLTEVETRV